MNQHFVIRILKIGLNTLIEVAVPLHLCYLYMRIVKQGMYAINLYNLYI